MKEVIEMKMTNKNSTIWIFAAKNPNFYTISADYDLGGSSYE